jgi:hypothetical protein
MAEQLAACFAGCCKQACGLQQGQSIEPAAASTMSSQQIDNLASSFSSCIAAHLQRPQLQRGAAAPADDAAIDAAVMMAAPGESVEPDLMMLHA